MAKHPFYILQVHFSCSQEDKWAWLRQLALTVHSARQGTGAMLEALQQLYIFLAKQTMFTAVFLNSSLVQQLKYIVLNKQPEF